VLQEDAPTHAIFEEILRDEVFHMNYCLVQLARISPKRHRWHVWKARMSRLWKGYLRLATAFAGAIGGLILTIQYFVLLPPFAWLAKRAERREKPGWTAVSAKGDDSLKRQY
jgi:hypothetical protein